MSCDAVRQQQHPECKLTQVSLDQVNYRLARDPGAIRNLLSSMGKRLRICWVLPPGSASVRKRRSPVASRGCGGPTLRAERVGTGITTISRGFDTATVRTIPGHRLVGNRRLGEVYKARDTRIDRIVAIKVVRDELARDPAWRARFERERLDVPGRLVARWQDDPLCRAVERVERLLRRQ
jgi:hypothetical protein